MMEPAGLADGRGDLANLGRPVGIVGDAVDLEKIHAPVRIELQHGVVVGLPGGIVLDAPVAIVPGAGRCGVGGIGGKELRARDGQIGCDHLPRNTTDDVNAKLEPLRVQPVSERLESGAIGSRGKSVRRWNQQTIAVPKVLFLLDGFAGGVGHVPALVDDGVFPPELLQRYKNGRVVPKLLLVDGEPIGIPTVPAERRSGCKRLRRGELRNEAHGRESSNWKNP